MDNKSKRYDRQLRLWQAHGQMKLEEASLCLINASSLSSEILKNLVLPGIGSFTILDREHSGLANDFFSMPSHDKSNGEAMLPYLLELNEEVKGIAVNSSPSQMIKSEINFFKKFNLIIATELEEEDLVTLSEFCYSQEIALVVVKICGFFGYLRVITPEMCIIETHPEQVIDLRIDKPFKELEDYISGISFESLDSGTHGNIPFAVLLLKVMQEWKREYGRLPESRDEKNQFKERISRLKELFKCDSENVDEALAMAYRAWTPTMIPSQITRLMNDSKANNLHRKSKPFWVLVRSLSDFVNEFGVLPLAGAIPDMKADTESYIYLQKLYRAKARQDLEWIKNRVFMLCDMNGILSEQISVDMIERFCKNCSSLSLIRTSSLKQEYNSGIEKSKVYSDYLSDPENNFVFYLLFRALDKFRSCHHRYPGDHDVNVDSDVGILKKCLNSILSDLGVGSSLVSDDYIQEIVRAGGSHLPCIAGIMGGIASQEIIKIITNQYVPLNNTLIFNGISSSSTVFEL